MSSNYGARYGNRNHFSTFGLRFQNRTENVPLSKGKVA